MKIMSEDRKIKRLIALKKTGASFYIIIGILLILAATAALILWDQDELMDYIEYFIIGGIVLYGGGGVLLVAGLLNLRVREPTGAKAQALFVSGLVLLAGIPTSISLALFWEDLFPGPFLYPRQNNIEFDAVYSFETQFGDFNTTIEMIWSSTLSSGTPKGPEGYAWGESYTMRGFVHLYNATGNQEYLDNLLNRTDTVYNNSDRNNDGIPGYGTDKYEETYVEYIVWDGVILMPLAQIANIIKNNITLWSNTTLQTKANNYINVCEEVIQKWNKTNWYEQDGKGYYVSPPENDTAIFNRIAAFGLMMYQVYDFTGNATYLTMNQKIARFMKGYFTLRTYMMNGESREMYSWGYDWNGDNSDTSHACLDLEFVIDSYERGVIYTLTDMRRFANTFVDFIYRGRPNQTAELEWNEKREEYINHTNTYADNVNGETGSGNHYLSLRQSWFQTYRYHENTTLASFVVLQSLEDFIRAMPTRPPYDTSISTTYLQAMAALREMAYINGESLIIWM